MLQTILNWFNSNFAQIFYWKIQSEQLFTQVSVRWI